MLMIHESKQDPEWSLCKQWVRPVMSDARYLENAVERCVALVDIDKLAGCPSPGLVNHSMAGAATISITSLLEHYRF